MPNTISGQIGTYNQTVGVKVFMDDAIYILPVDDVPGQRMLGGEPVIAKKVEWLEEELTPQTVTVNATSALASATVVVTDSSALRVNDVLVLKDAAASSALLVLVTAINGDGITLTVTRPFAGSTDVALAANDVLAIAGQYTQEGSDPAAVRSVDRTSKYNLTQIMQEKVEVSRTEERRAQRGNLYGVTDPYDHEVQKKYRELAIRFERQLINGRRNESGDLTQRTAGGFFYYITTNTRSNTKANLETATNDILQDCYSLGGSPKTIMCSPAMKRLFSALNNSTGTTTALRVDRADDTRGTVVDNFASDFGNVNLVMNRYMPRTKALVLQTEFDKVGNFDDYFTELLAKTGDATKGQVVAEKTLVVKNEKAQGVLTITDA